jgi:hypothetical protein
MVSSPATPSGHDDSFISRIRKLQKAWWNAFHDPNMMTAEVGRWRWKQVKSSSLAALRANA